MSRVLVIGEKTSQVKKFVSVLLTSHRTNKEGEYVYSYLGQWNDGIKTYELQFLPLSGHVSTIDTAEGYGWREKPPIDIVKDPAALIIKYNSKYRSIINKLASNADEIWLATDPDSEGDNIAYESLHLATSKNPALTSNVSRIWNSSLTQTEILRAFKSRGSFDDKLAMAVQGRRFADAWLGFAGTREITLAAKQVMSIKVMSVGRVQLPTLKRIVDRDEKIAKFVPVKKWNLVAALESKDGQFKAYHIGNPFDARKDVEILHKKLVGIKQAIVTDVKHQKINIPPPIPLNTTAALSLLTGQLKITADRALKEMEKLYLDGYLSYPRTDNPHFKAGFPHSSILTKLTKDLTLDGFIKQIKDKSKVRRNGKKQGAEDHDPIHPTGEIPPQLSETTLLVWTLLTRHYIGLFMDDQIVAKTSVNVDIGGEKFKAAGNIVISPGWTQAINWTITREKDLPPLQKGMVLDVKDLVIDEFETKPLPRWSDSKILKEMEKLKIGTKSSRPEILSKLIERGYVIRNRSQLQSTEFGQLLTNLLSPIWPDVVEPTFTRHVEELMDEVALGKAAYQQMREQIRKEYLDLHVLLQLKIPDLKTKLQELVKSGGSGPVQGTTSNQKSGKTSPKIAKAVQGKTCPSCGSQLVMRTNRSTNENFLGCSKYPACRYTEPIKGKKAKPDREVSKSIPASRNNDKSIQKTGKGMARTEDSPCPRCGGKLVVRKNKKTGNNFLGCSSYPKCTFASPMTVNEKKN
ncbi:MAG: DNA topoisomerase [Candidatus Odinarchaeota archaeon]